MAKPLIGINPYYFEYQDSFWNATKEKYYAAVWIGEGIPVTLHYPSNGGSVEEIIERIDGLVIVGGPDVPNHLYKGNHPELLDEDVMLPEREKFDRTIFQAAMKQGKPILAICAGIQHINVIYGGTLYEDLSTQKGNTVNHGEFKGDWNEHSVELEEYSLIRKVMKSADPKVASTHHQGIRRLGLGLKAVGWAPDGLIEAIEYEENPEAFIAVQWHPEIMLESEEQMRLFHWVSNEANKRKRRQTITST